MESTNPANRQRNNSASTGVIDPDMCGRAVAVFSAMRRNFHVPRDPRKAAQADIDGKAAERNSQIAYIAGGALVVTGIVLYVVGSGKRKNAVAVAPMVTSSSAGLAFGGSF